MPWAAPRRRLSDQADTALIGLRLLTVTANQVVRGAGRVAGGRAGGGPARRASKENEAA